MFSLEDVDYVKFSSNHHLKFTSMSELEQPRLFLVLNSFSSKELRKTARRLNISVEG
jgi:hypothetical protein